MNTPPSTPAERLALSREALRRALVEPPRPNGEAAPSAAGRAAMPVVRLLMSAARGWWSGHPLQAAGSVAVAVAGSLVRPLARRHPVALLLGAFAFGGAFAWSRAWRWLPRTLLLTGVLPQLALRALAQWPAIESTLKRSRAAAGAQAAQTSRSSRA